MADKDEIVISVNIDTAKVAQQLGDATNAIRTIKSVQKDLDKALKEGTITSEEYGRAIAANKQNLEKYQREVKSSTALLQAETLSRLDDNASLDQQRQLLNAAQKAYALLSGEAKEAADAEGGLRDQINKLSDSVKEQEAAIGDHRRNVGNYAESIQDAFGGIAKSAGDLAPAVSILRSMGGESKKLGDVLDMVGKVMQLVGKAGNQVATAMKAQTVATEAQTTAQKGLNVVMAANPIGLIIAGISTLLPLIQTFCNSTKDAEDAQKAFNDEQERYSRILEQREYEYNFEIELMKLEGKTDTEIAEQRKQNAWDEYNTAKNLRLKKEKELQDARDAGKRKLAEELETQVAELQKSEDKRLDIYKRSSDAVLLAQLKAQKTAIEASEKLDEEAAKKSEEKRKERQDKEREEAIRHMEDLRLIAEAEAATLASKATDLQNEARAMLESLNEDEEEDVPTLDEAVARMFGLDAEGVEYFKQLLDDGVSFAEAKTQALADQTLRMAKSWGTAFGSLGGAFSDMGDMLAEFSEDSEEAAAAQKGFAFVGILLNQAQSISNGALAIAEGIASAASIPFPGNIPAIISIIAQITSLMAGVGTSIAQAKQIFAQADDAQRFEHGGIVDGTSYTGDNVIVRANSREMFLPVDDQKRLFDALTGNGDGSLGLNYEMLAAAVASLPAPVMDYSEFTEFQQKVSTYNEIAAI